MKVNIVQAYKSQEKTGISKSGRTFYRLYSLKRKVWRVGYLSTKLLEMQSNEDRKTEIDYSNENFKS